MSDNTWRGIAWVAIFFAAACFITAALIAADFTPAGRFAIVGGVLFGVALIIAMVKS